MTGHIPSMWIPLLSAQEGPYSWTLKTAEGDRFICKPPYPTLEVTEVINAPVKELVWQSIRARGDHANGSGEIIVGRLVALLENGNEVEMQRTAIGAAAVEPDKSPKECGRCGLKIWAGPRVDLDGVYFHAGCVRD